MEIKKITVLTYNPEWPKRFEEEADIIQKSLQNACIQIHHIGSTSVPHLAAKEDLDILCVVDQLSYALLLERLGYAFKGELNIPLRYYFSKNTSFSKVNLHVVEKDHGFIDLNLCFRNFLRSHDDVRDQYQRLKYQLIADPSSFERVNGRFPRYTLEKDTFIKSVLNKAGFTGLMVNICTHYQEWETYHRIREEQIFNPIGVVYDRHHPTLEADGHVHHEAALRSLAIDEPYQHQGYGNYFMTFLEKWVKHHGVTVLKMHARPSAEGFYRKLGYGDMVFDDPSIQPASLDLGKLL